MTEPAFHADTREVSVRRKTSNSYQRFRRAEASLAGGVSTGFRRAVRPYPLYFSTGHGSRLTDVDGNCYLDYSLGWGPLILGHTPREIVDAVSEQLQRGFTFGAQHDLEFHVSELMTEILPCADLVAFSNSGTEIVQLALRLARAYTAKPRYLKFEGHYHGWDDSVLVSYHPTAAEIESSRGQPIPVGNGQRSPNDAVIAIWNDRESVERVFSRHGEAISAVICEPLLCNSCCIAPEPGFLEFLRDISSRRQALLIFDEVITGFRLRLGGAQEFYGVTPDLATYGKALGSGFAVSALAGGKQYMDWVATGRVIHSGTMNGNPIALAAAKATMEVLRQGGDQLYAGLWRRGEKLRIGLEEILLRYGHLVSTSGGGPVFHLAFGRMPARNYRETLTGDNALYSDFALALLDEGVLCLPDGRWYISAAHSDDDIKDTLAAVERATA